MQSLQFSPLVPTSFIMAALIPIGLLVLWGLISRRRGAILRLLALAALLLALLNPGFVTETREPLPNTVAIVVDDSQSQSLNDRKKDSAEAAMKLQALIAEHEGLEARLITVAPARDAAPATRLFSALHEGLADLPPARLSGVIIISDGEVHDIPQTRDALGFKAPLNALITGRPQEFDRKAVFIEPPRFAIVKKPLSLTLLIEDQGDIKPGTAAPELRLNGEVVRTLSLTPGKPEKIEITLSHAGDNIIELVTPTIAGELTDKNNHAVINVNAIRQNLRVLLVSGEPHNGERVWRDLLKSDTNVDLIHFTILRLPERSDDTPENELSLIAFPTTELFIDKINSFDLMIFDRYQHYNVMPRIYYDFMAQYVQNGGALLMATGPEFTGSTSLALTALQNVIPVTPTGTITEKPFRPTLTEKGMRHPVTRGLSTADKEWGRWLRQIEIKTPEKGDVLMHGADDKPLMLLAHVGKGRVGMLLSDEGWLWARGFEGGGPYAALYRRMAHWLMQEPELEEEALTVTSKGNTLFIHRQTMQSAPGTAKITTPSGKHLELPLEAGQPGIFTAELAHDETGLFVIEQGDKTALAYLGPVRAPEYDDMISTPLRLKDIVEASGGHIFRLHKTSKHKTSNDTLSLPGLSVTETGGRADALIVRPATQSRLIASHVTPLFSGVLALGALLLLLCATWYREGK